MPCERRADETPAAMAHDMGHNNEAPGVRPRGKRKPRPSASPERRPRLACLSSAEPASGMAGFPWRLA
jgi:hypothetical protein